jgi:CO/xanthine dehydrogenase FAD-binding subunit
MTEYLMPTSVEQAIDLLERCRGEARVIAGGTDVMPGIRKRKIQPRCLVDITRIPGLDQIETGGDFVTVGAAVTFAAIRDSAFLNRHVHALVEAARSVGTLAIQAAATWAGNIVQAMPAADGAIVAVALEAEARVADRGGVEWRRVESLFAGPGVSAVDPSRQLITHVRFPVYRPSSKFTWGTDWRRVGRRPSLVLPVLNCAVKLCLSPDGTWVRRACIALGPVAPRPFRARRAEAFLKGQAPTGAVFAQAAHIAQGESNPRSSRMRASREYRLAVIPPLVGDGLALAAERARRRQYIPEHESTA